MKYHRSQLHSINADQKCQLSQDDIFCHLLSRQCHAKTLLVFLFAFMMLVKLIDGQTALNSNWPVRVLSDARELTHCEGLGFINATKNECGYCTGGNTELSADYGKDCKGKCDGTAILDCAGVCGGSAFTDECSGQCIGGTTGIPERGTANPYRDCRGYCLVSGGQFYTDSCGVCHSGTSPFEDCTNRCHLPGQEHAMAKLLCGRCVGGTSGVDEGEVLDSCGNCRSEGIECICNGTGNPDPCGVCFGGGKSCMRVLSFFPQAAPNKVEFDIFIEGAFRGRSQNLRCLLTALLPNDELGLQSDFTGSSNGTHLRCRIQLAAGLYRVGASIDVGETPEVDHVESTELLIYDYANYTDMTPFRAVFDRDSTQELILTFTGGKVPPRPLTCIVTGSGWPQKFRLARSARNSLDTCIIPFANSSMKLNIAPSLNGIHPFKKSFTLTFYASPPEMKKYYIAEDGHAVVIVFDRPVNLCKLKTCYDVLNNDTIGRLGVNATCRWATRQQLVITVLRAISGDPIRITFKRGVLMQDDQQYALPKNDGLTIDAWYPQPSSSAQLAISGPTAVPFCGTLTLVGHFSSPKGDAQFFWTANRGDGRKLEDKIASALLKCRAASMNLDIALLEVGMNYTFILTAEHPINEKYEARHTVGRQEYVGAIITAYSNVMAQPSVTVNDEVALHADISIPECVTEMESVQILWTVDNPKVKFHFNDRNSEIYKIMPYDLPENTALTFTAMAYFANLRNITTSKITLRVEPSMLKAVIKGSSKRTVGNMGGFLVLESDDSYNRLPLVYQWRCFDQNRDICYNYDENSNKALLISREMQNKPKLEIALQSLKAGQELNFELQVFNANNRYQSSPAATVQVVVENGSLPQVVIQSVKAEGIEPFQRHPNTGAYHIPAQLAVTIYATIKTTKKSSLKSVKWDIKGFSNPFAYTTLNGSSFLTLEEDFLVDHGIYLVGVSACTRNNKCGVANLTIHAVPGVTLCELLVQPFVEYEEIEAKVTKCSVPIYRQPLTYQLLMDMNGTALPLSPPQTSTIFSFFGPPMPPNNYVQFSVQVCDKHTICKIFTANPVRCFANQIKQQDRQKLLDKAGKLMKTNNAVSSLALFLSAAVDSNQKLTVKEAEDMIGAASKSVVNRYVSSGQLGLVYSAMLPLLGMDDKLIRLKALAVMRKATTQSFAYEVKPPNAVLALGHGNVVEALKQKPVDSDVMRRVRQTLNVIVECISRNLPLGGRRSLETEQPDQPITSIRRSVFGRNPISMRAAANSDKAVGTVVLEEDAQKKFQMWKCPKTKNCDGSVVTLTLYPGPSPYPSKNPLVSPVLDVSVRNPGTGRAKPESFGEDSKVVRMSLTHNGNKTKAQEEGLSFKCFYWDEKENEWSTEGVQTMGSEGNTMLCWASHLSTFAVLEVYEGLSTSSVVGIVVAVLMGVFIIAMLVFVYLRKKQAKTVRVSSEALQPNHADKLQTVERNVAHVKKLTN